MEAKRSVEAGEFTMLEREWRPGDTVTLTLPMEVRLERRCHDALTVLRGPLIFALRIGEEFRALAQHGPVTDYAVTPTTPWNYGLCIRVPLSGRAMQVEEHPIGPIPFAPDSAPVRITTEARRLPQWTLEQNSAGPLPPSPVETDAPIEGVTLIPYGSTNLRITEFSASNIMMDREAFAYARERMVQEQLEARDITDARVLAAFRRVPRHAFVPPDLLYAAYEDRPLPLSQGQTISQPLMIALMLQTGATGGHREGIGSRSRFGVSGGVYWRSWQKR